MGIADKMKELAKSMYTKAADFVGFVKLGYHHRPRAWGGEALAGTTLISVGMPVAYVGELMNNNILKVAGYGSMAAGLGCVVDDVFLSSTVIADVIGVREPYREELLARGQK